MIRHLAKACGLLATVGLSACAASPAVHFHSLALPSQPATSGTARRLVEILPVALPGAVDRPSLVLQTPDGRLDLRTADRWAGPLADDVRAVLDDALWRTAQAADVYAAPPPADASPLPHYRLAVRLTRFEAVLPGGTATVEAAWTLRRLPAGPTSACRTVASFAIPADTAAAASQSLAQATQQVANTIAQTLPRQDANPSTACP